jgi:hypothetical protein
MDFTRVFSAEDLCSQSPPISPEHGGVRVRVLSREDMRMAHPPPKSKATTTVITVVCSAKRPRLETALSILTTLNPAPSESPKSVLYGDLDLFSPQSSPLPSTGWSKVTALLSDAYDGMIANAAFFCDGAPFGRGIDGWNVVHGAQAMAWDAGLLTHEQVHSQSVSLIDELSYDQRVQLAACIVVSVKFQRQNGIANRVNVWLPEGMLGPAMTMAPEVGLAYTCFLSPTEQREFRSNQHWRAAHNLLRAQIDHYCFQLVAFVPRSFELMGRNVLCAAEEALWALRRDGHCLLANLTDVLLARAVAVFLVDSSARAFPGLVFEALPEPARDQRARGLVIATLAVVSGNVLGVECAIDPIATAATEKALVRSAVDFLQATLSVPKANACRPHDKMQELVTPAALHGVLCALETYRAPPAPKDGGPRLALHVEFGNLHTIAPIA